MAMIRLGDRLYKRPTVCVDDLGRRSAIKHPCEVIYIHPKRRFYTVRFFFAGGSWCESFWGAWEQYE